MKYMEGQLRTLQAEKSWGLEEAARRFKETQQLMEKLTSEKEQKNKRIFALEEYIKLYYYCRYEILGCWRVLLMGGRLSLPTRSPAAGPIGLSRYPWG